MAAFKSVLFLFLTFSIALASADLAAEDAEAVRLHLLRIGRAMTIRDLLDTLPNTQSLKSAFSRSYWGRAVDEFEASGVRPPPEYDLPGGYHVDPGFGPQYPPRGVVIPPRLDGLYKYLIPNPNARLQSALAALRRSGPKKSGLAEGTGFGREKTGNFQGFEGRPALDGGRRKPGVPRFPGIAHESAIESRGFAGPSAHAAMAARRHLAAPAAADRDVRNVERSAESTPKPGKEGQVDGLNFDLRRSTFGPTSTSEPKPKKQAKPAGRRVDFPKHMQVTRAPFAGVGKDAGSTPEPRPAHSDGRHPKEEGASGRFRGFSPDGPILIG